MTDNITGKIAAHSRSDATRPSRSRGSRCWALRSVIRQSPLEGRKARQGRQGRDPVDPGCRGPLGDPQNPPRGLLGDPQNPPRGDRAGPGILVPLTDAERQLYLAATDLLPTDGIVKETADKITAGGHRRRGEHVT